MPNLPCTIDGTTYERRYAEGPRRKLQVWNGTAYRTCRGGVTKKDLMMYKGHIVYKSRHNAAMKLFRKDKFEDLYTVYNHASARRALKVLDREAWDSCFKFTIERHPYEKAVSMAWFRKGDGDFADVLENTVARGKYRNYDLYTVDGVVAVDFIIRYERLAEDIKTVEEKLGGIAILDRFPISKGNYRGDRKPAAEHLSAAQKAKVQEVCAEEFELMGYER
jgi:hypothetical protein